MGKPYSTQAISGKPFLALLVCLFLTIGVSVQSYGQQETGKLFTDANIQDWGLEPPDSHVLSQRVSLNFVHVSIEKLLTYLEREVHIQFSYDKMLFKGDPKVTLQLEDVTLEKALNKIFQNQPINYYALKDGYVVLRHHPLKKPVQQETITGTVTDGQSGKTLPGVNILVKGTTTGTSTDSEGNFELDVPSLQDTLVVSFIGYQTRELPINGRTEIDIQLTPKTIRGEEMVVVGYGEMEKRSLTGSISQVKIENTNIDQQPVTQPGKALAGRLAGVNITQARNSPGSSPKIRIRGLSSISASNDPLIVIDGFPGGSLDDVNMSNVKSIEVLKDASAAAIYGSRGSGGVVLVTTKSGTSGGETKFSVNTQAGFQFPMLHGEDAWVDGGEEYRKTLEKYINREWIWQGGDPDIPMWGDERRPPNYRVKPVVAEGDYNWETILFDPALMQNYQISAQGGSEKFNYYVAGTYQNEDGVIPTTWYKQYSLQANIHAELTDNIRLDIKVSPHYSSRRNKGADLNNMIKMPPFVEPEINPETGKYYEPTDYWTYRVSAQSNPFDALYGSHLYTDSFKNLAQAKLGIDILENLTYSMNLGTDITYNTYDQFTEKVSSRRNQTTGSAGSSRNHTWLVENTLNYGTSFYGVHNVEAIAGAAYQKSLNRVDNVYAVPNSYQDEIIHTINNATAAPYSGSSKTHWGLISYFGRINYDYKNKYLLSASYRVDGSSRFGPQNRWGTFPSVSIGWLISQEEFMQDVTFINELKIRAGYGEVGNFGIGNFQYLGGISDADYVLNGERVVGRAQTSLGNDELRWETTKSMDIGLDASLFDNRLNITFDYYRERTSDLLFNVSIPAISGFTNTLVNVGEILNKGIELEVTSTNLRGSDFNWQTSFNFSRNRNEVMSLRGGVNEIINLHPRGMGWILRKGEPMFSYYGHEMIGVHMDQASIENNPSKPGAVPGTAMYKDQNNDGEITEEDRVILGNFMPDFKWGITNTFRWKNFDLSIHIQSKIGGYRYNMENLYYQGPTVSAFLKPAIEGQWWSPENPGDGETPATSLAYLDYVADTDYYLEPASYLAVRNVNFGYELPTSIKDYLGVNNLRAYVSIQNAFMFTREEFKAYNPEGYTTGPVSGTGSYPGYNKGSEPLNRTVVFGVNLDF